MMYQSTRDPAHKKYSAAEVIKMGLARGLSGVPGKD